MADFREYIVDHFAPVVAILASPGTHATCRQLTGQSLAEFLRPIASFRRLSAPVRTVGEQSYRIKDFQLRLHNAQGLRQASYDTAQAELQAVLTASAALQTPSSTQSVPKAIKSGTLERHTPWFNGFKEEFVKQLAFSDLETIDHPVACLLVVDAGTDDPLTAFQQLLKQPDIPSLLRHGLADGRVLKHYVLLSYDTGQTRQQAELAALRSAFGDNNCQLLTVISQPERKGERIGTEHASNSTEAQQLSDSTAVLSPDAVAGFFELFCGRALLPHLEFQVRTLYQQVMANRKGVRNQLKNLLWRTRSSPEAVPKSRAGPPGWLGSVEGQLRNLADLAFLMQDYELCMTTLKSLASDLKSTKDWKHYGAVQEMLGVTSFMAGLPPSEVISHLKEAFFRYDQAAGKADQELRRYATRSQLLLADYCCSRRMYAEANAALMRAQSQEGNMVAAVLLEQAALHLLHMEPPAMRKWAFHLVLAALRFSNCSQANLADAAYRQVQSVFEGQEWDHINAHLHDMLGKHAANQQDHGQAASHFAATLAVRSNHPSRQQQLLNQYLGSMSKLDQAQLTERASALPLPEVFSRQAEVNCDSLMTYANNQARAYAARFWMDFATPLNTGQEESHAGTGSGATYLAAVGEEITVDVDIYNPLALQLRVDQLRVAPECTSADDLQVEDQEVTLRGKERVRLRLKFQGLRDSKFEIKGISWRLEGLVPGYRALELRRLPQPRSRGLRRSSLQTSASFQIVSAMPHLQVALEDLPAAVVAGEVVMATARLTNTGAATLTSLRMLSSHPHFICLPDQRLLGQRPESVTGLQVPEGDPGALRVESRGVKGAKQLYTWPADFRIEPGQSLEWPFLLSLTEEGFATLNCTWQYEAQPSQSGMPHRLLNWSHTIQVTPSLSVKARLLPTAKDVKRCLLQMQISVDEELEEVEIEHIASKSSGWEVTPLTAKSPENGTSAWQDCDHFRARHGMPSNHVCSVWPSKKGKTTRDPLHVFGSLGLTLDDRLNTAQGGRADLVTTANTSRGETDNPEEALSLVVGWRIHRQGDIIPRLGLTTFQCRLPQTEIILRAAVMGETKFSWDFSQGPLQVDLTLQLCHFYNQAASICCETAVDLHLEKAGPHKRRQWMQRGMVGSPPEQTDSSAPSLSRSTSAASSAVVETGSSSTGANARAAGAPCLPTVVWTGQTQTSISQLGHGTVEEVPLQVLVFGPGRHALSDYAIYWTFPDGALNAVKSGPQILLDVQRAL